MVELLKFLNQKKNGVLVPHHIPDFQIKSMLK